MSASNNIVGGYHNDENYDNYGNYVGLEYLPEETNPRRFVIGLCELFNQNIHGKSPRNIQGHYLTICRYKILDIGYITYETACIHNEYLNLNTEKRKHCLFPNYGRMIDNENYIKPEIIECIYLQPSGHCIAIIKTFWIKIIQRTWKNIMKKRRKIILKSATGTSLRKREINSGKSIVLPGLYGMLAMLAPNI